MWKNEVGVGGGALLMPRLDLVRANQRRWQGAGDYIYFVFLPEGSGPFLEVLQYQANPWKSRSKLLRLFPVPKISLISKYPSGIRIRY